MTLRSSVAPRQARLGIAPDARGRPGTSGGVDGCRGADPFPPDQLLHVRDETGQVGDALVEGVIQQPVLQALSVHAEGGCVIAHRTAEQLLGPAHDGHLGDDHRPGWLTAGGASIVHRQRHWRVRIRDRRVPWAQPFVRDDRHLRFFWNDGDLGLVRDRHLWMIDDDRHVVGIAGVRRHDGVVVQQAWCRIRRVRRCLCCGGTGAGPRVIWVANRRMMPWVEPFCCWCWCGWGRWCGPAEGGEPLLRAARRLARRTGGSCVAVDNPGTGVMCGSVCT